MRESHAQSFLILSIHFTLFFVKYYLGFRNIYKPYMFNGEDTL